MNNSESAIFPREADIKLAPERREWWLGVLAAIGRIKHGVTSAVFFADPESVAFYNAASQEWRKGFDEVMQVHETGVIPDEYVYTERRDDDV